LTDEGFNTFLIEFDGTSFEDLKQLIISYYWSENIVSIVLIGNLPVAWFELFEDWNNNGIQDYGESWVQFPCDLYFTDTDGIWNDTDGNGIFDYHEGDKHPFATKVLTMGQTFGYRDNAKIPSISGKALKVRGRSNFKVEHFEDQVNLADYYKATAAVAASDTALTVSSSDDDHFVAGDVLLLTNASGQREVVIIASVAANTLNVTNLDGTTRTAGITMTTSDKYYN